MPILDWLNKQGTRCERTASTWSRPPCDALLHARRKPQQCYSSLAYEALVYEMPLGMMSRTAVLWHGGEKYTFHKFIEGERDSRQLSWKLECADARGACVEVRVSGRGRFVHRLPYVKTDCSGRFEVANDSLALARMIVRLPGKAAEELTTDSGAALEMAGS